ncbi:MAG: GMC family oxidoreductase N-terminal domain-containing protein [Burkholderiales bacterium]|nr:GMC family oxidoreductase N-terminal domain-containing protein [Anaerolineae bacterium]
MTNFDYLIVGGGSAGAIVAARLAEARAGRIALFEAGPSDEGNATILELRQWPALLASELDYDYRIEDNPRANGKIQYARGKVLGGCSSHNSCIAFVPPDEDMDGWRDSGAAGWSAADTRPYFDCVLEKVCLETAPPVNECGRAMIEAAQQAGFPLQRFNEEPLREGVGWFQLNKRGPIRESSSVAYLHPLSQWDQRLTIFTETLVSQIIVDEQNRAVGIETSRGTFTCNREVVVCCGAIDTPKLLLLSGIGAQEHLNEIGIPLVQHLPGVGQNLQDHPEGVINWEAAREVPLETTQLYEIGIFAITEPDETLPNLMFHFGTEVFDIQTARYGYPTAANGFCLTPNVTRAKSTGFVKLRSANPADAPVIDLCYFSDPYDERVMVAGIKLARRIAAQPALQSWVKRELTPGDHIQTDEEISAWVRQTGNTVYHPAGTCRIGTDELAVVDPTLRVHGIDGLRVADASVFPKITTINPNLTCMMIGERCADFILRQN